MEQLFGICRIAVAPLRATPADKAEISSQLLFGEHVEILEKQDRWWYVKNAYEGYEGWLDFRQLSNLTLEQFVSNHNCSFIVPPSVSNIIVDAEGTKYYLSPASNLPEYEDGFCRLGDVKYEVLFEPRKIEKEVGETLIEDAFFFQNVPYLWGGRNLFGLDCSGFVQTVFKLNNIRLHRDAWQQAEQGVLVDFLQEAQAGDLAFFDNEEGRITHVGLMLNQNQIIHSSAKVRVDTIDNQGIFNAELGRYTHKLRIIKRFL
ncbi:MAG: hydrolase [Pedobacter sp.]|nr:MAG: hydrolase [Pedobacter sp.]